MERKLVKQGRNALTVTLPAKWLQEKGLKAGDSVYIEEKNKELAVSTRLAANKTSVTLNLVDSERSMMWHSVIGKYIEGYDTIIVHHNNPKAFQSMCKQLMGMIIEEHTATRTVFKSVIAVPEDNFHAVLRRAAHVFVQQAYLLEAIAQKKAKVEDIKAEEALLDENLMYCLRYLNKYENRQHAYRYFLICATMELAGDQISRIAEHIKNDGKLAKIIIKGIEDYTRLLFTNDLKKLYSSLRAFREQIPRRNFVDGLAYSLAETLYNYLGYIVEK